MLKFAGADPSLIKDEEKCPPEDTLKFPNGLQDYLEEQIGGRAVVTPQAFAGKVQKTGGHGSVEWAVGSPPVSAMPMA